jgi:hypothetical protein
VYQNQKKLPHGDFSMSFGRSSATAIDLDSTMSSNSEVKTITSNLATLTKTVNNLQLCVNERLCQLEEQVSEMSENLTLKSTNDAS